MCIYIDGYQTFTYYHSYESDEHGDKNIDEYVCRLTTKKSKQIREVINHNCKYDKSFICSVFKLLQGLGVIPNNDDTQKLSSFQCMKKQDNIYRSTMSFYGKDGNEWMDWVNVKWQFSDDTTQILPARILMFIDIMMTNKLNNNDLSQAQRTTCPVGRYWAVVKSAKCECSTTKNDSNIAKYYLMEDDIHLISCLNIVGPAYVIHDRDYNMIEDPCMISGTLKRVIHIKNISTWSDIFMSNDIFNR